MSNIPALVRAIGNRINTTLSSGINASDLTISLASGSGLNANGGYVIIDKGLASQEIIYLESVSGTTGTVATNGRGVEGTSAASHSSGASVQDVLVKNHIEALVAAVNALPTQAQVLAAAYPVGSIYISTVSTNPNTLFGFGTWSAFGAGKVLVSLDSGDADFDVAEETGGTKTKTIAKANLPSYNLTFTDPGHTHTTIPGSSTQHADDSGFGTFMQPPTQGGSNTGSSTTGITVGSGGSGTALNIMPPYIVTYMFKRTA